MTFADLLLHHFISGTRITYDRDFLITFQNSPLARSAPKNLPVIPGVTVAPENKNTSNKATSPKTGNYE